MAEKSDDLIAADRLTIRLEVQLDLALRGSDAQSADQVHAFIVFETGPNRRRLPARGPGALQRRDQRKARFIRKNEGCAEFTPLFLYAARDSVSNARWLGQRAPNCAVAVFGNSSPSAATGTTHCSNDSEHETSPRSEERSGPASSNLRHSRTPKPHASRRTLNAGVERQINGWDARALLHAAWVCGVGTRDANGTHSGVSCRSVWQPG